MDQILRGKTTAKGVGERGFIPNQKKLSLQIFDIIHLQMVELCEIRWSVHWTDLTGAGGIG